MTNRPQVPPPPAPAPAPTSSGSAASAALALVDGSFEELMREKSRMRKQKEDCSVAELRVQLQRMERALAQEVKRRVDGIQQIQQECRTQLEAMESKYENILQERAGAVESRVGALEERVTRLEQDLSKAAVAEPAKIQKEGARLQGLLEQVRHDLETEKRDRLHREGRLLAQLESHAAVSEEFWVQEKQARVDGMQVIQQDWQAQEESRHEAQESLEKQLKEELEGLRIAVDREAQERMAEDDEIVAALNRYTDQLQSSLATYIE